MIVPSDDANATVVVIDDDPEIREALQGLLQTVGLRAELFASVTDFLDSALGDLDSVALLVVGGNQLVHEAFGVTLIWSSR